MLPNFPTLKNQIQGTEERELISQRNIPKTAFSFWILSGEGIIPALQESKTSLQVL
jgi:hypothetical protein